MIQDGLFDRLFPRAIRGLSAMHWTPVEVALRAAKLLVTRPGTRVLDVGAGAGKFCLVGAMSTFGEYFGVERRADLVHSAQSIALALGVKNVTFCHGLFGALNPENYDAFYFFNPFEETKLSLHAGVDWSRLAGREHFDLEVQKAQQFLRGARPGTRVVTYNGMGGSLPWTYDLVHREDLDCPLELWVKDSQGRRYQPG